MLLIPPLTSLGIAQAKQARDYFQKHGINFDHTFASKQERASDTLEIAIDMPYQHLNGIKEMNFRQYEGERVSLQPKRPEAFEIFYVQFNGEAAIDVQIRMRK